MKVLQVGKYYYPYLGGIETVLRNLAEGLAELGDSVTVLCSAQRARRSEETLNGVRVIRAAKFGTFFSQPLSPGLPRDLLRASGGSDIVHFHTPNPLSESAALAIPRGLPVVVSWHSDIVRQKLLLPAYAPILRRFLDRADRIVVATENHVSTSPFLRDYAGKCQVIPYGLDAERFRLAPAVEARARELREKHGPYFLFIGRLVGYKGVSTLLGALQHLRVPGKALIMGEGPMRQELEEEARSLGVSDRAVFLGRVPDGEPFLAHLHGADTLVLPSVSRAEAFGLSQLEAMAAGKPSIISRLDSGVTLVNEHEVTGLHVEPSDPRALAVALERILSDPALRERMGRAARERFEARFTRRKMVEGYRQLYRELTKS